MHRHALWVITLFIIGIIIPTFVFATYGISFGGLITATTAPGITCTTPYGPLLISSQASNYFVVKNSFNGIPSVGKNILGLYSLTPDLGSCVDDAGTPVPVYDITLYGVS